MIRRNSELKRPVVHHGNTPCVGEVGQDSETFRIACATLGDDQRTFRLDENSGGILERRRGWRRNRRHHAARTGEVFGRAMLAQYLARKAEIDRKSVV